VPHRIETQSHLPGLGKKRALGAPVGAAEERAQVGMRMHPPDHERIGKSYPHPIYRLEWQTIGSLQRRLRNCTIGVRAEPFSPGSDETVQLELHLMRRAAGMPNETPAVRP